MILIVSFPDNEHVAAVREHLRSPHVVLDVASFPARSSLSVGTDSTGTRAVWRLPDGERLDLATVGAVWYRRLRPLGIAEDLDETGRLFAWSESTEALTGTWYTLDAYWMNHPLTDDVAQRKVHQLRLAVEVGLEVPETLVTNDPQAAREFVERLGPGHVVRKAFRNIAEAPRQNALVGLADVPALDLVSYAPVIFQAFVPAELDLRVIVVAGEVFAAAIRSGPEYQVDYRSGLGSADVRAHRLPEQVSAGLCALMARLGVTYGAIDLRLTPDGRYVFLEINPAGEYLFASSRTGQPVPQAIAAALTRGDAEARAGRGGSDLGQRYVDVAARRDVGSHDGHGDGGQRVTGGDQPGAVPVQVRAEHVPGQRLQPFGVDGERHGHLGDGGVGERMHQGHDGVRGLVRHPDVLQGEAQERDPATVSGGGLDWSCCV